MRSLLRFMTCGSVDDGKSTLIGRLLYDSKALLTDQLDALAADSRKFGTQGQALDLALLVDGLAAEREQGITIDVAYRFFSTPKRAFIVADTPGHEQYTRNMATGASTADAAVLLVDARKGVLTQTKRHSTIVRMLGIRSVVLAVNKMDLVDWDRTVFERIAADYQAFATTIGLDDITAIPLSALTGGNVVSPAPQASWYVGPTLGHWLETADGAKNSEQQPFRMAVQWINRPDSDFRGIAGYISTGRVRPGDAIRIQPSGKDAHIARIVTYDGDLQEAFAGQSVTLTLAEEVSVSRGDLLCATDHPAGVSNQFETSLVWMGEAPMLPGRRYLTKFGPRLVGGSLATPKYRINVNTQERMAARTLALNEIGVCNLRLDQAIGFDPYEDNRDTGGFIVIDPITKETIGAGFLRFALHRASNVVWQNLTIDQAARARQKGQTPAVLWFTGLPGAGKSTVANRVEQRLFALGRHTYLLDGDNVRHGLNGDLGFTPADRVENIRRIAEVAKLMADAGLIVLVACISPFRVERAMARELIGASLFREIFMDAPLAVVEARDPKGLYAKARAGLVSNVTGIDSPYEAPECPTLRIDSQAESVEDAATRVLSLLDD